MQVLKDFSQHNQKTLLVVSTTGTFFLVAYGFYKYLAVKKRNEKRKKYPKDVVILHQFPRGQRAPSVSPFALKLETWLRMTGIKYQNDFSYELSPKLKMPWITYNGLDISDSEFCIEFLMKTFKVNLSDHLSDLDQSIARAFLKLNEESLRWVGLTHRFRYGKQEDCGIMIPALIFKIISKRIFKEAEAQGYGRHSKEELYSIGLADMKAIETFINGKKFLMGERVCNEDASIFGLICQAIHHDRGPLNEYVMNHCPNMLKYVETIKNLYWKDWDEQVREKRPKKYKLSV